MKILLTGATGYIGKRLLPLLVNQGHEVLCCVRDKKRFNFPNSFNKQVSVIEVDLLDSTSLKAIPDDINVAFYLVHSMSNSKNYQDLEKRSANNFNNRLSQTKITQVIYLSGIVNESILSTHLNSRKTVEEILSKGSYSLTCLRAGVIVGSGSASFEIMRDLVEKLPIMITPKWLLTKCQPICISDVQKILINVILNEKTYNRNFDIGGKDILTYKEMLLAFAKIRKLHRTIITVPVMTPKLSSYWLYFVTSTSYKLATSLVDSMKVEVVCRNSDINKILNIEPVSYIESLEMAFDIIENDETISSWKDSYSSSGLKLNISDCIHVPTYGCFRDIRSQKLQDRNITLDRIWSIGGDNGWYCGNLLWKIRGIIDKMIGGVGLRRGRTQQNQISVGDALDFWRVLYADKEEGRLLLYAEMKLPGEAWLEFKLLDSELIQTATFRSTGLLGRLYWYSVKPLHEIIFEGLIKKLVRL